MLKQLRGKTLATRLTIALVGPWLLSGCALWGDLVDPIPSNGSPTEAGIERFVGELRPLHGDAASAYRLGRHYQQQGRHQWAIEEFRKAVTRDPQHARAWNALGVSLDHRGNYAAAQKAYRQALAIDDQLDYVWNNLGYSAMLQGHPEEAAAHYRRALALNSDHPRYRNNLKRAEAERPQATAVAEANAPDSASRDAATSPETLGSNAVQAEQRRLAGETNALAAEAATSGDAMDAQETPQRAAVITEGPARPLPPFEVVATLAQMAKSYTVKLSHDFQQIVRPAHPDEVPDGPPGRPRVVTVKPATARATGFRFEVRPVLPLRARADHDRRTPTVLTLSAPAAPRPDSPLRAASLNTRLQLPRAFEGQLATMEGPYVKVVNGNGVTGMAGRISRYLTQRGFSVGHAANAEHFNHRSTVLYFPPGHLHEAWEVARTIPGFQEMKETAAVRGQRPRITLLIGRDVVPHSDLFSQG